jgi:hypothetical protein
MTSSGHAPPLVRGTLHRFKKYQALIAQYVEESYEIHGGDPVI